MNRKPLLGAHWSRTNYSKLYQLYRRVENVAVKLEERRRGGWVATKDYIEELLDIAAQLKVLDSSLARGQSNKVINKE